MQSTLTPDGILIGIDNKKITGTNISSGSSYNYASIYAKVKDGEYITVNYEWQKEGDVPDFVIALMELIKGNKETAGANPNGAWSGKEAEYEEIINLDKGV